MSDRTLVIVMLAAFVVLVTTHVNVSFALLRRPPRWRAPVAFFVPPLAPIWAFRERWRVRAVLWLVAAVTYAVALFLASRP